MSAITLLVDIAAQNKRVVAVVSLDGYSLKSKWYKLHWFKGLVLPRLLQKSSWAKLINRLGGKQNSDKLAEQAVADDLFLETASPEKVLKRFNALLERKVPLLCLFTGGVIDEYSYRGQLADAAPALANSHQLSEVYYPEMDHLLMIDEDRKKIVDTVVEYIQRVK